MDKRKIIGLIVALLASYFLARYIGNGVKDLKRENLPTTEKIGNTTFYTAHGIGYAFDKAKKGNRPVFTVFYSGDCDPCNFLKDVVLKDPDFKKVNDMAICLLINGDTEEGNAICNRYNIQVYPSIFVLSPRGDVLAEGGDKRSVENCLKLLKEAGEEENISALEKKLKESPGSLETVRRLIRKLPSYEKEKKIKLMMDTLAKTKSENKSELEKWVNALLMTKDYDSTIYKKRSKRI